MWRWKRYRFRRKKRRTTGSTPRALKDYTLNKWREEKHKLVNQPGIGRWRVIAYVDYLNKFNCVFNQDNKNIDDIYTPYPPELEVNNLYYFENKQKHVFPREFNDRWILARLLKVFPSSESDMGDTWVPKDWGDVTEFTAVYWFYVVNVFDTEEDLLRATVLRGFKDVINDNKYISKIPKINEITHVDNGIISNSRVRVWHKFDNDPDNWDQFKIFTDTVIDKTFSVTKMLNSKHENPER